LQRYFSEEKMLGRLKEAVLITLLIAKGEATIADIYETLADHKIAKCPCSTSSDPEHWRIVPVGA
jgi:hypothetical protein